METCTTCSEQPAASASSIARSIAASSARGGREATHARQSPPSAAPQLGRALGVHGDGEAERGGALHAGAELVVVDGVEVVDPRVAHERLEADHAAGGELVDAVERAGHEPAPEREVDLGAARAAASLASKAAPSTVGGWALSGISTQAVAPPAASAAVPVAQPSQSARPGSLKCTWASIAPGSTCSPRASTSSPAPSELGRDRGDHAVLDRDVGRSVAAGAPRSRRGRSRRAVTEEALEHVERHRHVGLGDRLGRVVADAALAAHEQHRDVG